MTLTEAINSGQRFKRPHHPGFIQIDEDGVLGWGHSERPLTITTEAVLATDWQLESDYVFVHKYRIEKDLRRVFPQVSKEEIENFTTGLSNV